MNGKVKITVFHVSTLLGKPQGRSFEVQEIEGSLIFIPGDTISEPELRDMIDQTGVWTVRIIRNPRNSK